MKKVLIGLLALSSLSAFAGLESDIREKFSEGISQYELEANTVCIQLALEEIETGGFARHTIRSTYGCKKDATSKVDIVREILRDNKIRPFKRGTIEDYEFSITVEETLRKH